MFVLYFGVYPFGPNQTDILTNYSGFVQNKAAFWKKFQKLLKDTKDTNLEDWQRLVEGMLHP